VFFNMQRKKHKQSDLFRSFGIPRAMNFIKSDLRSRLSTELLNVCMRIKCTHHTRHTLPLDAWYEKFKSAKDRRMLDQ
jgi:hypothetical protein